MALPLFLLEWLRHVEDRCLLYLGQEAECFIPASDHGVELLWSTAETFTSSGSLYVLVCQWTRLNELRRLGERFLVQSSIIWYRLRNAGASLMASALTSQFIVLLERSDR